MSLYPSFKLITDNNLVIEDGTDVVYVERSLKERVFTKLYGKCWQPLKKNKLITVIKYKPDPSYYMMQDKIICHPDMWGELKRKIQYMDIVTVKNL